MRQLGNLFLEDNAVRLKLYWQDGYFWQEKKFLTVDRSKLMEVGPDVNGIVITLSTCTTNDPRQLFTNQPSAKFEIRTVTSKDKCLTQHHHPKSGEIVYVEGCSLAHATNTGYWAAY
jgi:hypothetical protein